MTSSAREELFHEVTNVPLKPSLIESIRNVVTTLVRGNFAQLVSDGRSGRLTEDDIRFILTRYPGTLTDIPEEGWVLGQMYISKNNPNEIMVDLPLWTKEQGRSDLTLQLFIRETDADIQIEIDDIHVL